ncbi:MAG: MgtC/SapB family protein [Bacteroidota bacterium]
MRNRNCRKLFVHTPIGFIGAGAIIQSRGTITGLTTAATIWVLAAI